MYSEQGTEKWDFKKVDNSQIPAKIKSLKSNKACVSSAIRHFHYNIPAIRPLWCHSSKVAHLYGLRKCKRPTSDTYRYTELLKCDQIGKIPTYMEETYVLLHNPIIIIIHFS